MLSQQKKGFFQELRSPGHSMKPSRPQVTSQTPNNLNLSQLASSRERIYNVISFYEIIISQNQDFQGYRKVECSESHSFPSVQLGRVVDIQPSFLPKKKKQKFKFQRAAYDSPDGQHFNQTYPVNFKFHPQEQFFSEDELIEAIQGFVFTSELKTNLKESAKNSNCEEIYKKYWQMLNNLKPLYPKLKIKDYDNIIKSWKSINPNSWRELQFSDSING